MSNKNAYNWKANIIRLKLNNYIYYIIMLNLEEIKQKYKEEENLIIINDLIECKLISYIENLVISI